MPNIGWVINKIIRKIYIFIFFVYVKGVAGCKVLGLFTKVLFLETPSNPINLEQLL